MASSNPNATYNAKDIHKAASAYLEQLAQDAGIELMDASWRHFGAIVIHKPSTQFIVRSVQGIHLQQADDLLFFVRKAALATSRRNRLIVRRKGRHLPTDCAPGGTLCDAIDWPRSALLNMVLQTPFYLSVSACSRAELPHVLRYGGPSPPSMTQVTKHVFASPTRVDVNLDSSRTGSAEPDVTYPHICFAVDNFDCAFESLVLCEQDHCYSVCLWGQAPCVGGQGGRYSGGWDVVEEKQSDGGHDNVKGNRGGTQNLQKNKTVASDEGFTGEALSGEGGGVIPGQREGAGTPEHTGSGVSKHDPLGAGGLADQLAATHLVDKSSESDNRRVTAGGRETQQSQAGVSDSVEHDNDSQCETQECTPDVQDQATPLEQPAAATPSSSSSSSSSMVLLFAGYVSFGQLQAVVDTSGLHPLRLWMKAGDAQHHVLMKGPGGVGHADVAVTVCSPRDSTDAPTSQGGTTPVVYRADTQGAPPPAVQLKRALFSSAAKLARAVGGREQQGDAAVRCALMTLTLPVDQVARQLFGVATESGGEGG